MMYVESFFHEYGICIFLILLALYNIKNIIKGKNRKEKAIHVIISFTLVLVAIGFVYIHLLIDRYKKGL